jgi:hypothetical protein
MFLRYFPLSFTRLLFLSLPLLASIVEAQKIDAVWKGGSGYWADRENWSTNPVYPNNNGVLTFLASIDRGSVVLDRNITIEQLMFGTSGAPTLWGSAGKGEREISLNVRSHLGLNQGLLTGKSILNALGSATISGDSILDGWAVTLSGRTLWTGRLSVGNASVIDNLPGATIDLSNGALCTYRPPGGGAFNPDAQKRTLNNYGTINANSGGAVTLDITLNNRGMITVASGSLVIADGGETSGAINIANGATLDFETTNLPSGPGTTGPNWLFTQTSSISGMGSVKFNSWSNRVVVGGNYDISGTTTVSGWNVSFTSPVISLGSSLVVNGDHSVCDLGSNSVKVGNFNLRRGTITGSGIITVNGPLEWNEGSMVGGGTTDAAEGVFFNGITGSAGFNFLNRTLNCYGSSSVQTTNAYYGSLNFGLSARLNIMPGATFNGSRLMIDGSSTSGQMNGVVTNYGTLVVDNPGVNHGMAVFGTAFVNQGNIQITNSTLDLRTTDNLPAFTQTAGSVQLQNGNLFCKSVINGGSLSGYGTVAGIVNNGLIAPAGGILSVQNNVLTLQDKSVLAYVLNGTQPGISFGQIVNVSTATLGGILQVTLSQTFRSRVQSSDVFTLLAAQTVGGQFTNVASGARLPTADGSGSFVVTYSGQQIVLSSFSPAASGGASDGPGSLVSPGIIVRHQAQPPSPEL